MAKPRMDLLAFVGKLLEKQDGDVLREGIRVLSQALMESEVAGLLGAERHERTGDRTAYRERQPHADLGHAHGHGHHLATVPRALHADLLRHSFQGMPPPRGAECHVSPAKCYPPLSGRALKIIPSQV